MTLRLIVDLLQTIFKILQQITALRSRRKPERKRARAVEPPAVSPPAGTSAGSARRRSPIFRRTVAAFLGGAVAGGVAYFIVKRRQRLRARNTPIRAPFPEELLEVLATPGGGHSLYYTGEGLLDADTGDFYPVVDGIPDFGSGSSSSRRSRSVNPYGLLFHRLLELWTDDRYSAGALALAGSMAYSAGGGWCLSVSRTSGVCEIEMARANPEARIVCLNPDWDKLLEARLRALEASLSNLYFVRGGAERLPLRSQAFHSAWTANVFHFSPQLEQAMVEMFRVTRPGALVAGLSLVPGGSRLNDGLLRLRAGRLPGLRDVTTHLSLLASAGLREVRAFRDGAAVRFVGTRAQGQAAKAQNGSE